jgi:hypothetical protein
VENILADLLYYFELMAMLAVWIVMASFLIAGVERVILRVKGPENAGEPRLP